MMQAWPLTEQDIIDIQADLREERAALDRLHNTMPLPGREAEYLARVAASVREVMRLEEMLRA